MSNNPQTRKMRFRQVERCLDSGMQIRQWCKLNKVPESTFYGWLKIYREQSGGKEKSNRDWIELSRQEIKNAHALAVKTNGALLPEPLGANTSTSASANTQAAVRVNLNGAVVVIPSDCDITTIKSVLSVVAAL